jgi:hypothetical protein
MAENTDVIVVGGGYAACWRPTVWEAKMHVTWPELRFYAARAYSLIKPPSTGRRVIRRCVRSTAGRCVRGGASSRERWGRQPL